MRLTVRPLGTSFVALLTLAASLALVVATSAEPAIAANATIVVTSTGDGADANTGDGTCRTSSGTCTLRAAIETANQNGGADRITFSIPGGGVHRIDLGSQLPDINDQSGGVTLDGYSQPGAQPNTAAHGSNANLRIEIDGRGLSLLLRVRSRENTFQGLSIYGSFDGLLFEGSNAAGNRIIGSFIGTDAAGTYARPSGAGHGIIIRNGGTQNIIGEATLADRNIISGNGEYGIYIEHGGTSRNIIQNNVIGLNPSLTSRMGQWHGIDMQWWSWGNLVGGYGTLEGNLISGNTYNGIEFSHGAASNLAIGNYVGTGPDGNSASSVTGNNHGVSFKDAPARNYLEANVFGGNAVGVWSKHNYNSANKFVRNRFGVGSSGGDVRNTAAPLMLTGFDHIFYDNVFATNTNGGVIVDDRSFNNSNGHLQFPSYTHGNQFRQNQFHSFYEVSPSAVIDIQPSPGVNANDPGDGDSGPQDLLNTPDITGVGPGKVLGTGACGGCAVEIYVSGPLFADGTIDTSGTASGTGSRWIGTITASSSGTWSLGDSRIVANRGVYAIAIDHAGNTSEMRWIHRLVPSSHQGTNGPVGSSNGGVGAPAAPAMPARYVFPEPFSCSHSGSSLAWTGSSASTHYLFATTDGTQTYIGSSTGSSATVPPADNYKVRFWANGSPADATCAGPGPETFGCTAGAGAVAWTNQSASTYYIFGTTNGSETYIGGFTGLSAVVDAADSYRVRYWSNGAPTDTTCTGPGDQFSCIIAGAQLSWDDVGAANYFVWSTTNGTERYLGGVQATSTTVGAADAYRVRYWSSSSPIDTRC